MVSNYRGQLGRKKKLTKTIFSKSKKRLGVIRDDRIRDQGEASTAVTTQRIKRRKPRRKRYKYGE